MKKTFLFILALCAASSVWGEDKSITETYVNAGTGASTSRVSFKSSFDENFTVWQRGGRSKATDVVSIGGKDVKGFWLSRSTSSSCYIEWGETNKQYLGGVKSVSFAYKQFGSEANHTMILDIEVNGEKMDQISFPAGTSPYPTYTYSKDLNAKKLTKLTIRNSSTATEGTTVNGRFVVGPVTITPYLYCPSSAQNVQYKVSESATYVNPDFIDNTEGEATWSCAPEGIVTVADGVVTPIEGKSGKVVITATLNDIEVSYNLEVIVKTKSTPEISFEKEAIAITNLYTTEPVENKLTVTEGAGEVTYTSSNPLVAKIVENQVMVVGAGAATITATTAENEDYVSASASYALTVNEPEGETAVSEDFEGKLPHADSYQSTPVDFTDQDSIYTWTVNGHRYDGTWLRFATNANACMTSQGIQEGGVKRLSFTWHRANGECPKIHTTIKALDGDGNEIVDRSIELTGSEDQTSNQTYNMRFDEVKQNAQFYLRNESDGFVTLISDIKIIPYLLYTKKLDGVTILAGETQATYKNEAFINNTGATPAFSIISSEPASIATIAADGTVTATAAGTIKVQAAWEEVTTTYTLNIAKNSLPTPTITFADGNMVTKDMNTIGYVNTLTRDGDGAVSYESSDETVAEVDAEGVITIIGEGVTTITAKVAACQTYAAAEASYVLTTTDPKEDAYVETFDKLPDETKSSMSDRTGDWYTWKITTGARHKTTDVLYNGTRALWLSGNGGASMETTIEGGVKRVSFLWNKFNKTASPVKVSVTAGDITRELEKEVQTGEDYNQNNPDLVFNSNFGIKSNTNLKIANPQNTTALQIGPIAITPYIFYTVKDTLIDITDVATFTNDKLIDNRDDGVAIVYSIVGENDGVATIDAETGEVTGLKAGKVTVQAAYGEAKTTYTLNIHQKIDDGIVRILGIGNSFTQDALEAYIMPIILGQGKKAIVGYPYLGGCWQSLHVQNYKNDTKAYNYYKYDEEGKQTSTGKNGASLKQAITDERWDYVFIQSDHDSTGIVQSYIPHLNNLIEIVQTACSNKDVKIGMYMTWAYDSTSTRSAFAWYNNDSQTMYDSIINATQIMMDKVNVKEDMLIPAGTAIQNARTSYIGHTLNRDGYHLNYDYGRYIASLCYYSRIFGEDPKDVVYHPETISNYCADMCRAAAQAAMEKPFEVTDLVDYKEPTPPSPTKLNQTKGEELKVYKVVKDNQVMFVMGKTMYNIFGQQIR